MSQNQDTQSPESTSQILPQTLAQKLRLAATIIEHNLPWQARCGSANPWADNDSDIVYLINNGLDIRVTPLDAPSWSRGFHNPNSLPDAGGPEWRFCLLEELDGRYAGIAEIFMGDKWKITGTSDSSAHVNLNNCRCTYRLLRSVPFPDPPIPEQPWALGRSLEGFGELQPGQEWHRNDWTKEMLPDGWRPALLGETEGDSRFMEANWEGDKWCSGTWPSPGGVTSDAYHHRTKRPLPRPLEYVDLEPLDCPPGTAFRAPEQKEGEWLAAFCVGYDGIQGKFWEESWASLHSYGWFYLPPSQKEWLPCRKAKTLNA